MEMQVKYTCMYCSKTYQFQDIFENHLPTCQFFHKSRRDRLRTIESIESMPTQQELLRIVQYLTKTCKKLEEDVAKLKATSYRNRQHSVQRLLDMTVKPTTTYTQWIKSFIVKQSHLEQVFKPFQGLKEGVEQCMIERLFEGGPGLTPLRCFKEKSNMIYIWSSDTAPTITWQPLCNLQWLRLIEHVSHAFLKSFCIWEENNIPKNQTEKDRNLQYMIKIMGANCLKDKHKMEIRSGLQSKLMEFVERRDE